ncbi:MAG: four helix bundle protein [Spirosomataceae bacterium]
MKTFSFKDLLVWQKAHSLVLAVYALTKSFPKEELFGLTSQIRRSSVSVAANIAEGYRKKSKADKARYYNIAQGSLDETIYYSMLSQDLLYSDTTNLQQLADEVGKLLHGYIKGLNNSLP